MDNGPITQQGIFIFLAFDRNRITLSHYLYRVFYANHRKYLNPPGKSPLLPPPEFMTKKQCKHMRNNGFKVTTEEKKTFNVNFIQPKKTEEESAQKKFKKVANLVKRATMVNHENHINPDDWIERFEAGVKLWINRETGDVVTEKPWVDSRDSSPFRSRSSSRQPSPSTEKRRSRSSSAAFISAPQSPQQKDERDEPGFGTGSLVYDSKDVHDLFAILDSAVASKKH